MKCETCGKQIDPGTSVSALWRWREEYKLHRFCADCAAVQYAMFLSTLEDFGIKKENEK